MALFSALLVIVMTAPAVFHLSDAIIGNNVDNWIFYWNNWWLQKTLTEGHSLFHTPYLFAPEGASLTAHSNSFTSSVMALVVSPVVGPVAAYNLVILLGLWIGCLGMFYLVRELTGSSAAALFAASVFTFAPYHLTQVLAHAHLGSIHWWPFCALYLHRCLRTGTWRDALLGGVAFALTLWTGLQLGVMIALWAALYVLTWVVAHRRRLVRHRDVAEGGPDTTRPFWARLRLLVLMAVVGGVLSAPLLIPVVREWSPTWTEAFDRSAHDQTDLLAYVVPPTYNPIVGPSVNPIYERFVANRAYMPYLGFAALGLALLAWPRCRRSGFWFATFGLWVVAAAGSVLRVNGVVHTGVRLPYRWLADLFPFSTLRAPDRYNLLVVFTLAVLAGIGAGQIRRRGWLLALGLLMTVEFIPVPLLRWDLPPISPYYAELAQELAGYGVVDYPMGYTASKLWLYDQTLHGKPTVEGHISRYSPELYEFMLSNSVLRALYRPSAADRPDLLPDAPFDTQRVPVPDLGPALRDLVDHGIRYLLVHRSHVDATMAAHLAQVLPLAPFYEDDVLTVYDLAAPLSVSLDALPDPLSATATLTHFDVRQGVTHDGWQASVVARLEAPPGQPLPCAVLLADAQAVVARTPVTLFQSLDGTATWQAGDLDYQIVDLDGMPTLPSGQYTWSFACEGDVPYHLPDALLVDASGTATYRRAWTDIVFDGDIRLTGYRWDDAGDELKLTLWWEALEVVDTELIRFVHLLDAEGRIVAQVDGIPCEWTCPTPTWQPQVPIVDLVTLDLGALPAGTYVLAVGLYEPGTMERATAEVADVMIDGGYVRLPDTLVLQWSQG